MSYKVDIHTHILPENWPDLKQKYGYGGFIYLDHGCGRTLMMRDDGKFFREIEPNCWSPEVRIKEMNERNVDFQILSTVPVMFSYWAKDEDTLDLSRLLNNHLASVVAQYPLRFAAMGTLPLQAPLLAVDEIKRCVNQLGINSFQIGSHVNNWNLDDEHLFPIYKVIEDLGCSLFVHPWDMETGGRMSKYWLPWLVGMPAETSLAMCSVIFGGVLERFKSLKMCFAHGGGSFPYTLGRIQHGFDVRPDLCAVQNKIPPKDYKGRLYTDSLVHDPESLKLLINTIGEDNVMLGSDYPFPLGETTPGALISQMNDLTDTLKTKLLGTNAVKFFNLSPHQ